MDTRGVFCLLAQHKFSVGQVKFAVGMIDSEYECLAFGSLVGWNPWDTWPNVLTRKVSLFQRRPVEVTI